MCDSFVKCDIRDERNNGHPDVQMFGKFNSQTFLETTKYYHVTPNAVTNKCTIISSARNSIDIIVETPRDCRTWCICMERTFKMIKMELCKVQWAKRWSMDGKKWPCADINGQIQSNLLHVMG